MGNDSKKAKSTNRVSEFLRNMTPEERKSLRIAVKKLGLTRDLRRSKIYLRDTLKQCMRAIRKENRLSELPTCVHEISESHAGDDCVNITVLVSKKDYVKYTERSSRAAGIIHEIFGKRKVDLWSYTYLKMKE
jgi:hypothetical protein